MEFDGEIIAILNETYVLVKTSNSVSENSQMGVYQEIESSTISDLTGLQKIVFPKGTIKIIKSQGDRIYLASVSGEKTVRKTVRKGGEIARSLMPLSNLFGESEEIEQSISVRQAEVDTKQSLNISLPKKIQIGDKVSSSGYY